MTKDHIYYNILQFLLTGAFIIWLYAAYGVLQYTVYGVLTYMPQKSY